MVLLDGKYTSELVKNRIKNEMAEMQTMGLRKPHLVAILVGSDGASKTYVESKERNCQLVGFDSTIIRLDDSTSENELVQLIEKLNIDNNIDGILVQFPLPKQISENKITQTIAPHKDVDGFHDVNMGKLAKGESGFVPATPLGITMMLEAYNIETTGKHCVVIGRSNIVGRPMSLLMSNSAPYGNCTVTLCHSKTVHLEHFTRQADILIVALGKPGFVKANIVKPNAVVIDVGITRVEDSTRKNGFYLKGDVDFNEVKEVASYLTPVPGGVGLMTIAALLENTLKAYKFQLKQAL